MLRLRTLSSIVALGALFAGAATFSHATAPGLAAAGRGAPRLALGDGAPVGFAAVTGTAGLQPRALVAADLDRDGAIDLVAGYGGAASGLVAVYLRDSRSGAFLPHPALIPLAEPADWLAVGDFDGDGATDVIAAATGSSRLQLLSTRNGGPIAFVRTILLPGALSALAAGEIGRHDGQADFAAGIDGAHGPQLLVFAAATGALTAAPEAHALPAPARALAVGQFDDAAPFDVAVAAGAELILYLGTDARIEAAGRMGFGAPIDSLAAGRFAGNASGRQDLAVQQSDGALAIVTTVPRLALASQGAGAAGARLAAGKLGTGDGDDLLLSAASARQVRVLPAGADPASGFVVFDVDGAPASALALRALHGPLSELVVAAAGQGAPLLAPLSPLALTFSVNSTGDTADAVPGDGLCDNGSGSCTLRAAIQEANALAGADQIDFALGAGTPSITLTSPLPSITEAISIQGDTGGSTRVEINGNATVAPGLLLGAGSSGSTIRALVINRVANTTTRHPGIRIESANNVVEGCFLGTDANGGTTVTANSGDGVLITGAGATGNRIGGSTVAARNLISRNQQNGVKLDAGASGNQVAGNYIGTNVNGDGGQGNSQDGVNVAGTAQNNTIGGSVSAPGTAPGNLLSGNSGDGLELNGNGTTGNVVAGNLVGVRANGTTAQANFSNGLLIANGASGNTVGGTTGNLRNVLSGNSSDGVEMNGTNVSSNRVQGNFLGTTINGDVVLPNSGNGVYLSSGAQNNTIGGDAGAPGSAPGNLISGNNTDGVRIQSSSTSGNTVAGNLIGTNLAGTATLKNAGSGVTIDAAPGNTIGGSSAAARNVISGHNASTVAGIDIRTTGANNNTIAGNYIGTNITGSAAIANYNGIRLSVTSSTAVTGTKIGGETAAAGTAPGNLISGNGNDGILVNGASVGQTTIAGNLIGLAASGTVALKNTANGVEITGGAQNVTVGGETAAARNVISGNGGVFNAGVNINSGSTRNNSVRGNYLGTDVTGLVSISNSYDGVVIKTGANNNTIGGSTATPGTPPGNLISGNSANAASCGIRIDGATANSVLGNLIGTDVTGLVALPNRKDGIFLNVNANTNRIGDGSANGRNIIAGNNSLATTHGIEILQSSSNTVRGNTIGVGIDGATPLGNGGEGILITDNAGFTSANANVIGGSAVPDRNVIAANSGNGVKISGPFSTGNTIAGNFIGLAADGVTARGNGANGVLLVSFAEQNTVGGTTGFAVGGCSGSCNEIRANGGAGVRVDSGTRNAVRGNSIDGNGGLGIDLLGDGVTANDVGDGDAGPNNLINFPVISSATPNGASIDLAGTCNSAANETYTVELFAVASADPSGYGEGRSWLGTTTCTIDETGSGTWLFSTAVTGARYTGTLTDSQGNTSEFALDIAAVLPDTDGDGVPDASDCAPLDNTAFAVPAEVSGAGFGVDRATLRWDSLAAQAGSGTVYDIMRGSVGRFPVGTGADETCLSEGQAGASLVTAPAPATGAAWYYLVRGSNACGTGSYGSASDGTARTTTACQ